MAEDKKHDFVGSAKLINGQYGHTARIQIELTDLFEYLNTDEGRGLIRTYKTKDGKEKHTINLYMAGIKTPTDYKTHTIYIDKFMPDPSYKKEKEEKEGDNLGW